MGIVNVTPDSFSDGGRLYTNSQVDISKTLRTVENMLLEGADIIYIGDTFIDSKFAKKGRIDYFHASYGYGTKNKNDNDITSLKDLHFQILNS